MEKCCNPRQNCISLYRPQEETSKRSNIRNLGERRPKRIPTPKGSNIRNPRLSEAKPGVSRYQKTYDLEEVEHIILKIKAIRLLIQEKIINVEIYVFMIQQVNDFVPE